MKLFKTIAMGAVLAGTMLAQASTPPDTATIVARRVDRLTKLLGLSSTQAGQATTYFTDALNSVTPLETTLRTDRQSLQTAIKANDAGTIETLSTTIGSLTGQILGFQSKADALFYAILSPTQQTTLNASHGVGRGFGHGMGGPAAGH
jgi:hypothetical protein